MPQCITDTTPLKCYKGSDIHITAPEAITIKSKKLRFYNDGTSEPKQRIT
ncbi:hypothetical protein [Chryseobacterium sp. JK1]